MPGKAKPDDITQSQRFIDMAHEVEVTDSAVHFERAFASVATHKITESKDPESSLEVRKERAKKAI